MVKINVNYLCFYRYSFVELNVFTLKNIKEENKKNLHITFAIENNADLNLFNSYKEDLIKSGIDCSITIFNQGFNYMDKINQSVNFNSEYTLKFDEDIYLSNYIWDYLIENVDILNDSQNLLLSPLLSCGIPTVDLFIEDYFDEQDKNTIKTCFKNTVMPHDWWGCVYQSLNAYTVQSKEWNSDRFYEGVNRINHHYKGIHPVRSNANANILVNDLIWKDLSKLTTKNNYYIENYKKYPYMCNSCFVIKTDVYRNIVNNKSLFRDPFDEVPVNLYKQINNLNFCFIRNGLGIHYLYNSVPNYVDLEKQYYNQLKSFIMK